MSQNAIAPSNSSRRVNVSLTAPVHDRARELKLNVSQIADQALHDAVRAEEARMWREENADVLHRQDAWLAANGHPLAHAMSGPFAGAWREIDDE